MSDPKPTPIDKAAKREAAKARTREELGHDVASAMILGETGTPKSVLGNVLHIMHTHPAWAGVLAYDEFKEETVKLRCPPVCDTDASQIGEWTEDDTRRTVAWFGAKIKFSPPETMVESAVSVVAGTHSFHPVRGYLRSLKWDGVPRLARWLVTYLGVPESDYAFGVGYRWLISAVARVMRPGCQVDCMLVLQGPQGKGKSTAIAALFGVDWFSDTGVHIGNKDSYQMLRGTWVHEFAELASLKNSDLEKAKAFISARIDRYRPPYGRRTKTYSRQTVFFGTTNENEYLSDTTGNRRFLPVECRGDVEIEKLRQDRDQLWAEAVHYFDAGYAWHPDTSEFRVQCADAAERREIDDPWTGPVLEWLEGEPAKVSAFEPVPSVRNLKDGITVTDVLEGAIRMDRSKMGKFDQVRMGKLLRKFGYVTRRIREHGIRVRRYFKEGQVGPEGD